MAEYERGRNTAEGQRRGRFMEEARKRVAAEQAAAAQAATFAKGEEAAQFNRSAIMLSGSQAQNHAMSVAAEAARATAKKTEVDVAGKPVASAGQRARARKGFQSPIRI